MPLYLQIMKGIVLLAVGNKYYAQWAYNMAVSIRYHSPDVPIQLVYSEGILHGIEDSVFDVKTKMRLEDYFESKIAPQRAKLSLYKYLAFDESLYLDVDGLVVKDIKPLLNQNEIYHCQTARYLKYDDKFVNKAWTWAEPKVTYEHFNIEKDVSFPQLETGIQYFKRGEKLNNLFNLALSLYCNPIPYDKLRIKWGRSQPDELYIGAACALLGHNPEMGKPSLHMTYKDKLENEADISKNYYVFGLWGNKALNHHRLINYYDRLVKKYSKEVMGKESIFYSDMLLRNKFVTVDEKL